MPNANAKPSTVFITQTACARMPSSVLSAYRRVAVLEVEQSYESAGVAAITTHSRGCVRVVRTWERLYVGVTERSAYRRALAEARSLASSLNKDRTLRPNRRPLVDCLMARSAPDSVTQARS